MDGLPEDLVRMVLSHVASPWVVQVRAVCRQWSRILSCTHFALQWALQMSALHSHPSPHSLCLLSPLHLSALHLPSLLSIPLHLHLHLPRPPPPPLSSPLPLACSPLGILFSSLSLFHPLSRASLRLPPPLSIRTPLFAAFGSTSSSGFQILVLGPSLNPAYPTRLAAEIFSSVHSTWATLPVLPMLRQAIHIPRSTPSLVWWRDAFVMLWGNQILTFKPSCKHAMKAGIAEEELWGSISLPANPRMWDARFVTLHVVKDRLFLEGNFQEQGDLQRRYPLRIGVLEFDAASMRWKEVRFMPDAVSKRLCKQLHPAHCFYTAYSDPHSDHIYFAPYVQDTSEMEGLGIELVLFNVSQSSWSCIPLPPSTSIAPFTSPSFKGLTFHATLCQSTSSFKNFRGQSQISM